MKSIAWKCVTAALLGIATGALASGDCGMNTNKPCPQPEKLGSKEPAYKSMNSNKPQTTQAPAAEPAKGQVKATTEKAPARATKAAPSEVKPGGDEKAQGKATLTGVSAADLKVKPKEPATTQKEPAK